MAAFLFALAIIPVLLFIECRKEMDEVRHFDRGMHNGFRSLRNGMSKAEVVSRLGSMPHWVGQEFSIGLYEVHKKEYEKTNGVNAAIYYTWANGATCFYCVGFDRAGRMVVKGQGGT